MERPDFIVGNEEMFSNFVSNISKEDKVALVSHTDLDGIAAAKVVNSFVDAFIIKFVNYEDMMNDYIVDELRLLGINKIILTDLMIKDSAFIRKLEQFAKILIIDHHTFSEDYNSNKTVFLNAHGFCATYLCYYLFMKVKDIEWMDWIVACACISDWAYFKNIEWMKKIFEKYYNKFEFENGALRTEGEFWNIQYNISLAIIYYGGNLRKVFDSLGKNYGDIGDMNEHGKEVQAEIEVYINKFEKEKENINDGYFFEFNSKYGIKSILTNILSTEYYGKTLIIVKPRGNYYQVSARRADGKVDLNKLMIELTNGMENTNAGGHFKAAGATIDSKYYEEFKRRVKNMS